MKDSFILYTEQKAVIDKLTDEQAGKLIKAIYEYVETDKMPQLDTVLDLVITPFKLALDRNKTKYEAVSKKRAEAGAKGGKQKKQMQTKDNKHSDNDNVNDSDSDNVNDNDNNSNDVVSDSCVDGLQKVIDFYNNNIGLLTPYGLELLQDFLNEMDYDVIIFAMKKAVEANVRTIQYIKGTLNNWSKKGIKTLIEAEEENQRFKSNKQDVLIEETEEERKARKIKELEGLSSD